MAGKKGRSGRRKVASTLINEALERVDQRIPELFNKLVEKGLQGDRECLIYLIDRRLGKPKVQTEVDLTGGELLGAGAVVKLFQLMANRQKEIEEFKQIEESKDARSFQRAYDR